MPSTWTDESEPAYLDTVALLQEEIARLEAELRLRDESAPEAIETPADDWAAEVAEGRLGELSALLAERDETIGLLWEQLTGLEAVEAARLAEWDQLNRWVQELEDRIGREGDPAADPDQGLREAEALRDRLDAEQRAWLAERGRLEQEVAGLRSRLAEVSNLDADRARAILEDENRRLRDECRRLAALEPEAAEAEALREQLRQLKTESDRARLNLDRAADDLRRQRIEHDAELAALRTRQASARLSGDGELSPDERIRALRQHLGEMHEREERERADRQLSNRLSRLWHRSGSRR